jgi:hypothetical protein
VLAKVVNDAMSTLWCFRCRLVGLERRPSQE